MSKRDGNQKGAQHHPQGGHGDRTHKAIAEQLKTVTPDEKSESNPNGTAAGKRHIYDNRQQHDDADKHSEKARLRRDRSKGRA